MGLPRVFKTIYRWMQPLPYSTEHVRRTPATSKIIIKSNATVLQLDSPQPSRALLHRVFRHRSHPFNHPRLAFVIAHATRIVNAI